MIEVLNLGAGVQSSTVLLMSIHRELPRLDLAVFADTGWEPKEVYRHLKWLESQAAAAGVRLCRLSAGNIKEDALMAQRAGGVMGASPSARANAVARGAPRDSGRWASMPYFTLSLDGKRGQVRRQCTHKYKIRPIEQFLRREVLGLAKGQHAPKKPVIRRWYGISFDELQRMRRSDAKWAVNWYPLVEGRMSRIACLEWMRRHGYPEPPRSACIGCPYHTNEEWLRMKHTRPDEWDEAVTFDRLMRKCGGMKGDVFLHADRAPLEDIDLSKKYDSAQQMLPGMADECMGMCGV